MTKITRILKFVIEISKIILVFFDFTKRSGMNENKRGKRIISVVDNENLIVYTRVSNIFTSLLSIIDKLPTKTPHDFFCNIMVKKTQDFE